MAQSPIGPEDGTGYRPGRPGFQAFINRPKDAFLKAGKPCPRKPTALIPVSPQRHFPYGEARGQGQ